MICKGDLIAASDLFQPAIQATIFRYRKLKLKRGLGNLLSYPKP